MPYLVKFSDNYSDEFDVEGFKIYTDISIKELEDVFKYVANWFDIQLIKIREEKAKKYPEITGKTAPEILEMYKSQLIPYSIYSSIAHIELSVSFGTNEILTFNSFSDYRRKFDVQRITEEEFEVLKKYFPSGFGEKCAFEIGE